MRPVAAALLFALGLITDSFGQTANPPVSWQSPADSALEYFGQIRGRQFNDFLRSIRPGKISPEDKARALSLLPKADLAHPSAKGRAKLDTLSPILHYHERNAAIELTILRVRQATSAFLAGAAVIVTEPALEILTPEELQAIVAHELAHEYFWNEYELARQNKRLRVMQELELRCDGIAVITLVQLGFDPENLISGITRLMKFNERKGISTISDSHLPLEDRTHFIHRMIDSVRAKASSSRILVK
jgi:Zn-dependent protease with chaperone function